MKLKQSDRVKLTSKTKAYPEFINIGDTGTVLRYTTDCNVIIQFDKVSNIEINVNSFDLELIETRFEYDQLVYDKDGRPHRFLTYTSDNKMLAMISHNKQTLTELEYVNGIYCETFYATNPTEKPVKEMTVAEIESILGYTIKVVSNV